MVVDILLTCSVTEIQMTGIPALELICASLLDARTRGSGVSRAANAGVVRAKLVEGEILDDPLTITHSEEQLAAC